MGVGDDHGVGDAAGVHAAAAESDLGAGDGVAEAEDLELDVVAFGEVVGEAQPVVAGFGAVRGALEDDEHLHVVMS